jgi:hypothetical protein
MLPKFTGSTHKPTWLLQVTLATLTLSIMGLPASAASSPPQELRADFTSSLVNTHTLLGDSNTNTNTQDYNQYNQPDAVCPPGGQCFADVPSTNPFYTFVNRIYQQHLVTGYPCGGLGEPCDAQHRPYYRPVNNVTRQQMAKFIDNARRLPQIHIEGSSTEALIYTTNGTGPGVAGISTSSTGNNNGVFGFSADGNGVAGGSDNGIGIVGNGQIGVQGTGVLTGEFGLSTSGDGVRGISGSGNGVYGQSTDSIGVHGYSTSGRGMVGVSTSGYGVDGESFSSAGVLGYSTTNNGVRGGSSSGDGVYGFSSNGRGVYGQSNGSDGVRGESSSGAGVRGLSTSGDGVYGFTSATGPGAWAGVAGYSIDAYGVFGQSSSGDGVYGYNSGSGRAGYFYGNVQVTGNLSKGGGSFKIDHPLDPANKYLYHSFVESPDMMDVYNGNVTTDANGDATLQLPDWFEPLNRDFRYQLTPIGQFAQAMVSSEIKENRFSIKTDKPNVKVSWQVTGIRQDPYANAHRIPVEEDKPADEKGKYLHPTEWGQPESAGIDHERQQQMQRVTEGKP